MILIPILLTLFRRRLLCRAPNLLLQAQFRGLRQLRGHKNLTRMHQTRGLISIMEVFPAARWGIRRPSRKSPVDLQENKRQPVPRLSRSPRGRRVTFTLRLVLYRLLEYRIRQPQVPVPTMPTHPSSQENPLAISQELKTHLTLRVAMYLVQLSSRREK